MDVTEIDDGLDLTPRPAPASGSIRSKRKRRWPAIAALLAVVVAIGFVIQRAISDATVFFYPADEAVAKQPDLGTTKRFNLEGSVVPGSVASTAEGVSFKVMANCVVVSVNHVGDPADLFQDGIPVVLEGHWSSVAPSSTFSSDYMLVKHDEEYEANNPDRMKDAYRDCPTPTQPSAGQK